MKPQNKLQTRIIELAEAMPKLTAEQKAYGLKHALIHIGYRTKSKTSCLDCGHQWKGPQKVKTCACPKCGVKLHIHDTLTRTYAQRQFFSILDVVGGYQVSRCFEIKTEHKTGLAMNIVRFWEVANQWIAEDGKFEIVARNRGGMGYFNDGFHGYLEIRNKHQFERKWDIMPQAIYPKMKTLPVFKRNGFKGKFGELTPSEMFTNALQSTRGETLIKANQWGLLLSLVNGDATKVGYYWDSIKICLRNGYNLKIVTRKDKDGKLIKVNEASDYLDYLKLLDYFGKDLRNAVYVCPTDFKTAHDRLVIKKSEVLRKQEKERKVRNAAENEELYTQMKSAFFGICFGKGNITVQVLQSVQEFVEESAIHHHCIYQSEYFKKEDSLILSAKLDGKPLETVEVNLVKMKVVQSRGLQNSPSAHHSEIVELVTKNMSLIRKVKKELKKQAIAA